MTKAELIEMIEALQAKAKAARNALRSDNNLQSRAHTERHIRAIKSVCDRLALNWNVANGNDYTEAQQVQASRFLQDTIAEAELHLGE